MAANQVGNTPNDKVSMNRGNPPDSPLDRPQSGQHKYEDDLSVIRSMMERSSRFISLSGLSGVAAGLIALLGGSYALYLVHKEGRGYLSHTAMAYSTGFFTQLFILAIVILVLAVAAATYFTVRKSKKAKLQIWTTATRQLLSSLLVPLFIGGVACLALLFHGQTQLMAPATLIFYGLALMSASKFTFQEVYYLGLLESILGLISCFLVGYGLIFWIIGFGLLHIAYGVLMQRKYR